MGTSVFPDAHREHHMRTRHRHGRHSLGLYTSRQIRAETPFSFFAQIVVGAVFWLGGVLVLLSVLYSRSAEMEAFGSAEPHVFGFFAVAIMFAVGIFIAHAGMIYYGQRLFTRLRISWRKRNRHEPG